jgi:hypothetical protein
VVRANEVARVGQTVRVNQGVVGTVQVVQVPQTIQVARDVSRVLILLLKAVVRILTATPIPYRQTTSFHQVTESERIPEPHRIRNGRVTVESKTVWVTILMSAVLRVVMIEEKIPVIADHRVVTGIVPIAPPTRQETRHLFPPQPAVMSPEIRAYSE